MIELEEMWLDAQREAALRQAQQQNVQQGDVADYLRLRAANDAARQIGINWLFETFAAVAAEANRRGFAINIKKSNEEDLHVFSNNSTTLRGSLLLLQAGIRSLTVEAGYPRLPQDGFIRGNGLAAARITHFGKTSANADLLLMRSSNESPGWFVVGSDQSRREFTISALEFHFRTFAGEI